MTYRKNTKLGVTELVRLNDDGSISIVQTEADNGVQYIGVRQDAKFIWDNCYNEYSHINAREFNDAYNLVKENI